MNNVNFFHYICSSVPFSWYPVISKDLLLSCSLDDLVNPAIGKRVFFPQDSDAESKSTSKYRRDRDDQRNSPKQRESRDTSLRDRKDDRPDRDNRYGGRDRNEDRNR